MGTAKEIVGDCMSTGTTTNELTISGKFIQLSRSGQLEQHQKVVNEFLGLRDQLLRVSQQLSACNNCVFLSQFAERKGRNFETAVVALTQELESSRRRLEERLAQLDPQVSALYPDPITSLTAPVGSPLYSVFEFRAERETDEYLRSRNAVIDAHSHLSGMALSKLLDLFLSRTDGRVCAELPESWVRRYRVKSFREAYRHPQCGRLVRTLFSKRRKFKRGCG